MANLCHRDAGAPLLMEDEHPNAIKRPYEPPQPCSSTRTQLSFPGFVLLGKIKRRKTPYKVIIMPNKKTLLIDFIESGRGTRLGPNWSGQRCRARTRKGTPCQNPVVTGRNRCRMHGGKSTGPRTAEGKARVAAAHTKHGRRSAAHVSKIRYINAELRRVTNALKAGGYIP